MDKNVFAERGRALEDAFFHEVDKQLLAKLQQRMTDEETKRNLATTTGLKDERLLDELLTLRISPDTLLALRLAPWVLVAWADGQADDKERTAALQAAGEEGLDEQHPAYELLRYWLLNKPAGQLMDVWKHYVAALAPTLSHESYSALRGQILAGAQRVATASGGTLGLGRVSAGEKRILQELETFLEAHATGSSSA